MVEKPRKKPKILFDYKRELFKSAKMNEKMRIFKKVEEGIPLTPEELEVVKREEYVFPSPEHSEKNRHKKTFNELMPVIAEHFKNKKRITVNDIGYGEPGRIVKRFPEEKIESEAVQPWEVIDTIESIGKKIDYWGYDFHVGYWGYDFYPWKAKLTQEKMPEEYKGKARFGELDVTTGTPARQADVTVYLKVGPILLNKSQEKLAARHVIESTKKGGLIVTDYPLDRFRGVRLLKRIREKEVDTYIYEKVE